jgi:hypothetical protein
MLTLLICTIIYYFPPGLSRLYQAVGQWKPSTHTPKWNSYTWLVVYGVLIALGPLWGIWQSGVQKGIWVLAPAIVGLALFFAMDQLLHLQKKNAQLAGQSVYIGLLSVLALHMMADGVWIYFVTTPQFSGGLQPAALLAFCWHRYWVSTGLWKFQTKHFSSSISMLYWLLPLFSWVGFFGPKLFPELAQKSSIMETMNIVVASVVLYMLLEQANYHLKKVKS